MDINAFKKLLFDCIEKHENARTYEHSCNENEVVFSAYIGNNCFSVRCAQIASENKQILR